jgi:hypothetical protein
MEITQDIKNKWSHLQSHGDVTRIAKQSGLSHRTISNALRDDRCTDKVFIAIAKFYQEKQQERNVALGLKDAILNEEVA